jgi:hypothetical protein
MLLQQYLLTGAGLLAGRSRFFTTKARRVVKYWLPREPSLFNLIDGLEMRPGFPATVMWCSMTRVVTPSMELEDVVGALEGWLRASIAAALTKRSAKQSGTA